VQQQRGHKEVTANETSKGGGRGGGEDKLTVKRCEILGLPGIISNLRLSEDSS